MGEHDERTLAFAWREGCVAEKPQIGGERQLGRRRGVVGRGRIDQQEIDGTRSVGRIAELHLRHAGGEKPLFAGGGRREKPDDGQEGRTCCGSSAPQTAKGSQAHLLAVFRFRERRIRPHCERRRQDGLRHCELSRRWQLWRGANGRFPQCIAVSRRSAFCSSRRLLRRRYRRLALRARNGMPAMARTPVLPVATP
jgi:hypothetical protein